MSSDSPSAVSSGLLLFLLFSIIDKSCEDGDRSTDFMSQPEEFYRQTLSTLPSLQRRIVTAVAAHKSYATPVRLYHSQYYSGMFCLLFCSERRRKMTSAVFTLWITDPFPDNAFNVGRSLSGRSSRGRISMIAKGKLVAVGRHLGE